MADMTVQNKKRGRWRPGESGNPGGRPRALAEVRDAARAHTAEALATLVEVMRSREATPGVRLAAAEALLDRGWGRPAVAVAVDVSEAELPAVDVSALREAAAGALAALAERGSSAPVRGEE